MIIPASTAFAKSIEVETANKLKKQQEEEIKRRKQAEEQLRIDNEWYEKALKYVEQIIEFMIRFDSGKFSHGSLDKAHLRYVEGAKYNCDTEFSDKISDDVIDKLVKYMNGMGYGCEVRKPDPNAGCNCSLYYGSIYLWYLSEEEKYNEYQKEQLRKCNVVKQTEPTNVSDDEMI